MSERSGAIEDILCDLREAARGEGQVSVGDALAAFGDRGWGPLLFVPALIELTPVGGIPGLPTLLALIIALFAIQMALGRQSMWLPGFLSRRSISDKKVRTAVDKLLPAARRLDRWFPGRFPQLTTRRVSQIAAVVVVMLCLTVPPLEIVPFAASAPMAAIAIIGLALSLRDGVLIALGFVLSAAAFGFGAWMFMGGESATQSASQGG